MAISDVTRREFLAATGLCMAAGAAAVSSAENRRPAQGNPEKMNYIFLFTDDQGWGDLGCYGHRVLKTPNLDALAADGCMFTDFYAGSPVCAPSRAAHMTGRDPSRYQLKFLCHNGQYDAPIYHHVPLSEPSLPRQLQAIGYRTCHIGKWHLSLVQHDGPTPADYGFDHYLMQPPEGRSFYRNPTNWNRNGVTVEGKLADWAYDLYVDEAIDFMEETGDQPFYINLWTYTPHETVVCAQEYMDMYPGRTEQERVYYGSLTQQDEAFGRLFEYLDRTGLAERTVIIFASDNGPEHPLLPWVNNTAGSTGPFRGSKHFLFEGGVRVPGIIRWPGLSVPGSVSHVPVSTIDLFPTLCAATGATMPEGFEYDGADMRAAFVSEPVKRRHPLYWQFERAATEHRHRGEADFASPPLALRDGPWKLLCDLDLTGVELYNLVYDQGEKWNLAEQHPDIAERLLKEVGGVHREVEASAAAAQGFLNPNMPPPSREPMVLG